MSPSQKPRHWKVDRLSQFRVPPAQRTANRGLVHRNCKFKITRPAARLALNGVSQANNCAFLCLRFRSAVAKTLFADFWNIVFAKLHDFAARARVFMLLKRALIKITDNRCAVMLLDNIDDALV